MNKTEFHVTLSSNDSLEYYPRNNPYDFLVHLNQTL